VGLEVKASELMSVGGTALIVATVGVIVPFGRGWGIMRLWGEPRLESIFTGAAMVATSVGITAQVLAARGWLSTRSARVILAAAVVDDVLGLIVLAVVSDMAKGPVQYLNIALTGGAALGFTAFVAKFGTRVARRVIPRINRSLSVAESEFALAMTLLFALSVLAVYAGVAAIIGAFLAGMALSETVEHRVHEFTNGVAELLVPFFLVGIGLHFNTEVFASGHTLEQSVVIVIAAVVSKFVGCGLGAIRMGRTDAIRVGVGMAPRGEVGMVVAQIGLGLGIMHEAVYGVIVFMSVATTLIAPPLLKLAYRGEKPAQPPSEEMLRLG
jgi:Kef-type K+ transport system membrane component KefB